MFLYQGVNASSQQCSQLFSENNTSIQSQSSRDLAQTIEFYNTVFSRTRASLIREGNSDLALRISYLNFKFNTSVDAIIKLHNDFFDLIGGNEKLAIKLTEIALENNLTRDEVYSLYRDFYVRTHKGDEHSTRVQDSLQFTKLAFSSGKSIDDTIQAFNSAYRRSHQDSELAMQLTTLSLLFEKTLDQVIGLYNSAHNYSHLKRSKKLSENQFAYEIVFIKLQSGKSLDEVVDIFNRTALSQLSMLNRDIDPIFAMNLTRLAILSNQSTTEVYQVYRDALSSTKISFYDHEGNHSLAMALTYLNFNLQK